MHTLFIRDRDHVRERDEDGGVTGLRADWPPGRRSALPLRLLDRVPRGALAARPRRVLLGVLLS